MIKQKCYDLMFWIWSDVQRLHHLLRLICVFLSEMERIWLLMLMTGECLTSPSVDSRSVARKETGCASEKLRVPHLLSD